LTVCDWRGRQFQSEYRAVSQAFAVNGERAIHLLGGQGAAMQAESMSIFLGGESMSKNSSEVFRRDADFPVLIPRLTHRGRYRPANVTVGRYTAK